MWLRQARGVDRRQQRHGSDAWVRTIGASLGEGRLPVTYRARGTGSVTQLPNGKWRGAVEIGYTATGGRRRIAVSATTRKECERLLRDKLREIVTAGPPAAGANVTLKKWAEEWLHRQEARVRPKT